MQPFRMMTNLIPATIWHKASTENEENQFIDFRLIIKKKENHVFFFFFSNVRAAYAALFAFECPGGL
jgi:hypothetical protein